MALDLRQGARRAPAQRPSTVPASTVPASTLPASTLPARGARAHDAAVHEAAPWRVSDPSEHSEREADAAARAVVAGTVPARGVAGNRADGRLARCAGGCGPVSCHVGAPSGPASHSDIGTGAGIETGVGAAARGGVAEALAQPGARLPAPVLHRMQAGFGADLSSVRVHDGERSARAARSVGARAFTVGNHIVFGAGEYRPDSAGGQYLLAHELAHVVQQGYATPAGAGRADRAPGQAVPTLSRTPTGLYRTVRTACLAPSEVPSVTSNHASRLGLILEVPIVASYCAATGCAIFTTDYIDTDATSYIAFLAARNPHLTRADIAELALASMLGGVFRPDVLTHKPPRFEFEEIKPDSVSGRAAGRIKLAGLATLYARFHLPYVPGVTWSGAGTLTLFTLPGPVEVLLEWHRNAPGLVVYNLCVRGDERVLAAYGIAALLLAAILILLSRGAVLRGAPAVLPIPALAFAAGAAPTAGSTGPTGGGRSVAGEAAQAGVATASPASTGRRGGAAPGGAGD
ncbi:MAG TPA: DUF4157 domain-containing protein, partial [Acidimicrobiales bacterium]|nr:DUF4157 domain-containing protein [Acidimicrobiales bacterium]